MFKILIENLKNWWKDCPFFNKNIIRISIVVYFMILLFSNILNYLSNIPYYTIYKLEVYRPFTAIFANQGLLFLNRYF